MTISAVQPVSRSPVRWRRPLFWGLGAVLVLELLYNAVLATGLLAAVLNHFIQDRPRVEWSRAWSLIPGRVHVRDLKLLHEEPNGSFWQLEMDEVKVNLSLLALLQRQLRSDALDVQGLRVRLHPGVSVPGVEHPKGPPPSNPWQVLLHGVRVHNVQQLDWNGFLITGLQEASGSFELVPGQRVSVRDARMTFGAGQVSYEKDVIANLEQGSAGFSLEAQRTQGPEGGLDLISGMTEGRFQFIATHPAFNELPGLASRLGDISLRGGAGRLEVDLHVKDGSLAPGTQLQGTGAPVHLAVGPLHLRAPWRFHSDVYTPEDGVNRLGIKLTLGPVKMEGGDWPSIETPEVEVLVGAKAPRVDQLPQDAHVEVNTQKVQATWAGATMSGLVNVNVDAKKLALQRDTVVLHGSQVQFHDVSVRTGQDVQARNWDGTLAFPDATLALSPPAAKGRFSGSFSNADPFVALLTFKGALPGVLAPLLKANNLGLSGVLSLGERGLTVSGLHAQGQGLELFGNADSTGGPPHAVLLVKMGILSVGVETGAEGTHVQLLHPSGWYKEKTGEKAD